jgi:hypothetical protein
MKSLAVLAALTCFAGRLHAETDAELSRQILGSWQYKKIETFKSDGTWILWDQKVLGRPLQPVPGEFSWHIKNGHLMSVRDGATFDEIITKLTPDTMVLAGTGRSKGGHAVYERVKTPR